MKSGLMDESAEAMLGVAEWVPCIQQRPAAAAAAAAAAGFPADQSEPRPANELPSSAEPPR